MQAAHICMIFDRIIERVVEDDRRRTEKMTISINKSPDCALPIWRGISLQVKAGKNCNQPGLYELFIPGGSQEFELTFLSMLREDGEVHRPRKTCNRDLL